MSEVSMREPRHGFDTPDTDPSSVSRKDCDYVSSCGINTVRPNEELPWETTIGQWLTSPSTSFRRF